MNINRHTVLFTIIALLLFFMMPYRLANIIAFFLLVLFSISTLCRMNRKKWKNEAITKQERGRSVYIIAIYSTAYLCYLLNSSLYDIFYHPSMFILLSNLNNMIYITLEYCQAIMLMYLVFQVNLELNHYGSKVNTEEGILTRILNGRLYRQSNSRKGDTGNDNFQ